MGLDEIDLGEVNQKIKNYFTDYYSWAIVP